MFGMGPDTLEDSKVTDSRKQLDRALAATPELEPLAVTIFGDALKLETLRFPFNRLRAFDARDWTREDAPQARVGSAAPETS